MKHDEKYCYPSTPEELSAFYGWEAEILTVTGNWKSLPPLDHTDFDWYGDSVESGDYRVLLPRISDLRVGDVVKVQGGKTEVIQISHETNLNWIVEAAAPMRPLALLVSRNTWLPIVTEGP